MGEILVGLAFICLVVYLTFRVVRYYDRAEIQQTKREMKNQVDELKKVVDKYDRTTLVAGVRAPNGNTNRD
jgi:uncharacterized protein YcbK (DUF882 family)